MNFAVILTLTYWNEASVEKREERYLFGEIWLCNWILEA